MASMQDPLAKLERANEHVNLFEREIRSLVNPNSYDVAVHTDSKGNQTWTFNSPTPVVPLRLSTIVGDALFDFRAALDQIICQLVLANNNKPSRKNYFPIYISHEFDSKYGEGLRGISKSAVDIIRECQPKPEYNWELLFLPELNNIDKHRHLHMCVVYIQSATAVFDSDFEINDDVTKTFSVGTYANLKSGCILFSISSKYKTRSYLPRFDVGFDEGAQINLNEPVLEILRNIGKQIKNAFSALENEVNKGTLE